MFIPMTGNLKKKNYKIKISFRCNACPFISFKYLVFLNVQNVWLLTVFIIDFMYYVYNLLPFGIVTAVTKVTRKVVNC